MRKVFYLLILSFFLFSCEKQMDVLNSSDLEKFSNEESMSAFKALNDTIVPLDSADFPEKPNRQQLAYEDVFSNLYQLNGIDFFIQSKDSYFGKNSFQSQGKGQEVVLAPYSATNAAQLFHLKFYPPSSGIQYLIYSSKEQKPIGAGSYASNPNNYVLYTQATTSTSLFGFSWAFALNSSKDGYYVENQDVLGTGPGGPWDIYWYVLNVNSGLINFAKRNNSFNQQFNFIPNDNFVVNDVQVSLVGAEILSSSPSVLKQGEVINNTSSAMQRTLSFSETKTNGSSFTETSGITTRKSGNLNIGVKISKVVNIGGSFTLEVGTQETLQYGTSSSRSVTITESFNITVPPNMVSVYTFKAMHHTIKLPYTATMTGLTTNKVLNIGGVYTGVDYSTSSLEVSEYPAGSSASTMAAMSPVRTYTIYPEN